MTTQILWLIPILIGSLFIAVHVGASGNKLFGDGRYEVDNGWFVLGLLFVIICIILISQ